MTPKLLAIYVIRIHQQLSFIKVEVIPDEISATSPSVLSSLSRRELSFHSGNNYYSG